ncbi:MAG: rubrerythrin family protein [Candidatus Omnitrophica bacterium]|nr:rubrerythrin family protein [Candidatus Omnitrophota bacterium]MBI2173816.1 rubrerythrin family protein [Candidatus Omnitrophota bacterium]MBI3009788.1 rubrerythrin family protein [Candidatus Omnitrophota bacterium]
MGRAHHLNPTRFLQHEYLDMVTYRELAKIETVPEFKRILEALMANEVEDCQFWQELSSVKEVRISPLTIFALKLMRKVLGLTFTAKFLERHERDAVKRYTAFAQQAPPELRARLQQIIDHETHHEHELIGQIQEERVEFLGSIVLGVNDGLIELTGALVGFAFALQQPIQAGLFGTVTGIAASLSMAASAYMQARHETGKEPKKAGLYTGVAYLLVVVLLVLPYFLLSNIYLAVGAMFGLIVLLILGLSFYSSVLFDRNFKRQAGEMLLFSLGVAGISFLLGSFVRSLIA